MFNCKKLFKLQIRPPSLILLITTSQDRWIFPSQSWEVRNSIIIIIILIIIIIRKLYQETFYRITTKDCCTWNITHNTESTAVWSLKPERWGSPLVQEKYRAEKACDKRHPYRIIIIMFHLTWTNSAPEETSLPLPRFSDTPWLLPIMAAILSSSSIQRGYWLLRLNNLWNEV